MFDAVIGHDHITGPYACAKAKSRGAKYIHFLHTVPQESETLKTRNSGNGQLLKGETKRKMQVSLSKQASLVVAIGPKIFAYASLQLDGVPLLHNMMPGLNSTLLKHVPDQAKLVRNHCLLTGRMEDASLKGIELGCEAVLAAYEKGWLAGKYPKLIVRGFDEENADTQLTNVVDVERFADILQPREYTADRVVAYADLTSVSLLMMPSRSEAFGLTAYEAIAAGIPTLISDESGLAEYIQDAMDRRIVDKSYAETMICPARAASAKPIWAPRIVEILSNKEAAFARAENLRRQLRPILSWENAARALTNKILSV